MLAQRVIAMYLCLALVLGWGLVPAAQAAEPEPDIIQMESGQVMLEFVGQTVAGPPSPLGSVNIFGYVSFLKGVDQIFTGTPENETTARITFFTEATNTRATANGPFSVIVREGTTTLYLNSSPPNFNDPESFRAGAPIQVSTIRQQIILDNPEKTFSGANLNTITSATLFSLDGRTLQIGKPTQAFRTSLQGVLFTRSGGTPPPQAHIVGYAVGVSGKKN
jgi:hypothetical protein